MRRLWDSMIADESGATAIEYGLICALISLGLIASLNSISPELTGTFVEVQTGLASR